MANKDGNREPTGWRRLWRTLKALAFETVLTLILLSGLLAGGIYSYLYPPPQSGREETTGMQERPASSAVTMKSEARNL